MIKRTSKGVRFALQIEGFVIRYMYKKGEYL